MEAASEVVAGAAATEETPESAAPEGASCGGGRQKQSRQLNIPQTHPRQRKSRSLKQLVALDSIEAD